MKLVLLATLCIPFVACDAATLSVPGEAHPKVPSMAVGATTDGQDSAWYTCHVEGLVNWTSKLTLYACESVKTAGEMDCDGGPHRVFGCRTSPYNRMTGDVDMYARHSPPGSIVWEVWVGSETTKNATSGEQRTEINAGCGADVESAADLGSIMPGETLTGAIKVNNPDKGSAIVFSSSDMSHDGTIALGGDDALSVTPQDASAVADGKWIMRGPSSDFPLKIQAGNAVKPGKKTSILTATLTCE